MPNTVDLVGLAIDKNPLDFADSLNSVLMQKAIDAIEQRKIEVAYSVYGDNEEDSVDVDDSIDDYDIEDDDIDIDDLDLDDVDLDLDLEEIPYDQDTE